MASGHQSPLQGAPAESGGCQYLMPQFDFFANFSLSTHTNAIQRVILEVVKPGRLLMEFNSRFNGTCLPPSTLFSNRFGFLCASPAILRTRVWNIAVRFHVFQFQI
jgi:hypothetical protein